MIATDGSHVAWGRETWHIQWHNTFPEHSSYAP